MISTKAVLAAVPIFLLSSLGYAAEGDFNSLKIQDVYGVHSADSSKKSQNFTNIEYSSSYLEDHGYRLGFNFGGAEYTSGSKLEQSQFNASYWSFYTPDHFPTNITLFANLFVLDNNDNITNTNDVKGFSLGASFASLNKDYAFTPSYSYSQYQNSFSVSQYDLAMGFAFNDLWDWFSYKPAFIQVSDANVTGSDQYIGHYLSWTHYMQQPDDWLGLQSIATTAKFGDTAFSVDTATMNVYNLKDKSQYALGLDLVFTPVKDHTLLLGAGVESFNGYLSQKDYQLGFTYLQYIINW